MKKLLTKRNLKRLSLILSLLALVLVVSACANPAAYSHVKPLSHDSGSWWDRYVLFYLSQFIIWIAGLLGGSYGWAIIIFTIIIRVALLPLNAMQINSMSKRQKLQPQLDALKKKYPTKDMETRQKLQEETARIFKEAGVNPFAGFLPLIIQLPVILALYQAIWLTPQLMNGKFMWMNLGRPDPYYVMPVLAALFTWMSSYISQLSQPESANTALAKGMIYFAPLMVAFWAINFQSAISLYWVVSNLFQVGQTMLLQNPFKYRREVAAKKAAEREKEKRLRRAYKRIGRKRN